MNAALLLCVALAAEAGTGSGLGSGSGSGTGLQALVDRGDVRLRGHVRERGTRAPVAGIAVEITADDHAELGAAIAITDGDGAFTVGAVPDGGYTLVIRAATPITAHIRFAGAAVFDETWSVEPSRAADERYTVRARRAQAAAPRESVQTYEVQKIAGNQGDAIKVVQNLPGVARAPFNNGLIIVRGSAPEDTKVYFNGENAPLLYHFGGFTSVLNTDLVRSLDFYPGNYSVYYGRSTGGAIDVVTRDPRTDRVHATIDANVPIHASLLVEGPLTRTLSFAAAARRSYIDAFLPYLLPKSVGFVTAPRYYDYQLALRWSPAPRHVVRAFVYGSDDALSLAFEDPADISPELRAGTIDTHTTFHRAQLEWVWAPSSRLTNTLLVASGFSRLDFSIGSQAFFDGFFLANLLRDTARLRLAPRVALRAGVDVVTVPYSLDIRLPRPPKEGHDPAGLGEILSLKQDGSVVQPAAFAELEWRVRDDLTLVPGVRVDYERTIDEVTVDPRLNARWQIAPRWALKGGLGLFHQPPTPDETAPVFGNPHLSAERAVHASAGVEVRPRDELLVGVTGYYKWLGRLVAHSDATVVRDGKVTPEVYDNGGVGRAYGLEVLIRRELLRDWFGWLTYTLNRSERRDHESGGSWRLFDFDQTHILALLATTRVRKRWDVGARFRYVSGKPETPARGAVFDADHDVYRRVPGAVNSTRNDAFQSLDVRVDRRWVFDAWILDAYLDVQNVYVHANQESVTYSYDYTKSAPITGIPILPSLGIKGEF